MQSVTDCVCSRLSFVEKGELGIFTHICIRKLWKETQEAALSADPAGQGERVLGLGDGGCDPSVPTFESQECVHKNKCKITINPVERRPADPTHAAPPPRAGLSSPGLSWVPGARGSFPRLCGLRVAGSHSSPAPRPTPPPTEHQISADLFPIFFAAKKPLSPRRLRRPPEGRRPGM